MSRSHDARAWAQGWLTRGAAQVLIVRKGTGA